MSKKKTLEVIEFDRNLNQGKLRSIFGFEL